MRKVAKAANEVYWVVCGQAIPLKKLAVLQRRFCKCQKNQELLEKIKAIKPVDQEIEKNKRENFYNSCPEAKELGGLVNLVAKYGAMRGTEIPEISKKQ